jgi:hypothetical protein
MGQVQREIKHRDLGDIITETFNIYGRNFLTLVAITAVVVVPLTLLYVAVLNVVDVAERYDILIAIVIPEAVIIGLIIAGHSLMAGALMHAICEQHLRNPVSIEQAYRFAWRRIDKLIGANILIGLAVGFVASVCMLISLGVRDALGWPACLILTVPLTVLGIAVGAFLIVKWLLALQSIVVEDHSATKALSRSSDLVEGSWWWVFGTMLLFGVLVMVASVVIYSPFWIAADRDVDIRVIGSTLITVLATPLLITAVTLIYYNLRIKEKEFDANVMARELGIATGDPSQTPDD